MGTGEPSSSAIASTSAAVHLHLQPLRLRVRNLSGHVLVRELDTDGVVERRDLGGYLTLMMRRDGRVDVGSEEAKCRARVPGRLARLDSVG